MLTPTVLVRLSVRRSSSLTLLLGDHMCLRNRALALVIVCNFMVATMHPQSNGYGEMSPQKVQANKGTADSAALAPGHTYRDYLASGGKGPEMVVLPGGKFAMGSPKDEAGREENEGPAHDVSVRSFALGKYPVTRGEFARFAAATGYKTDAEKDTPIPFQPAELGTPVACFAYKGGSENGWRAGTSWRDPGYKQGDDEPVVCLSWNDARAYADWLSHETGKPYRLPTAAEMEYAIRAGSSAPYPWGSAAEDACQYGNVRDVTANARFPQWKTGVTCNDGALFTSAVGRYRGNAFGLFDTVGNVEVWTEDCGVEDYDSAPSDGSAQRSPSCERHTLRGSSWNFSPTGFRSAHRENPPAAGRSFDTSLRVAEDVPSHYQ
jgi:formylglycine-generating enzyme required for sulfatase activity